MTNSSPTLNKVINNLTSNNIKGTSFMRLPYMDIPSLDRGTSWRYFYYEGIVLYLRMCEKKFQMKLKTDYLFKDNSCCTPYNRESLIIKGENYPLLKVDFPKETFYNSKVNHLLDKYTLTEEFTLGGLIEDLDNFINSTKKINEDFLNSEIDLEPIMDFFSNRMKEYKSNISTFKKVYWWKMTSNEISLYHRCLSNRIKSLKYVSDTLSKIIKGEMSKRELKALWEDIYSINKGQVTNLSYDLNELFREDKDTLDNLYSKYKIKENEEEDF